MRGRTVAERFRYRPGADGGSVVGRLEPEEIVILERVLADVEELLAPEGGEDQDPLVELTGYSPAAETPQDGALRALLPDAAEDGESAGEFRRLTEYSLRTDKIADLRAARMLIAAESLRLSLEEAETLARAFNSVAIVLAERLAIRTDEDAAAVSEIEDPQDDDEFMAVLYNFVGWIRGGLSAALVDAL